LKRPEVVHTGRFRRGISTAALNSSLYFFGGNVEVDSYSNAYMSSGIDVFDAATRAFAPANINLNQGRKSMAAVSVHAQTTVVDAGGWRNNPLCSNRKDVLTEVVGGTSATNTPFSLDSDAFNVGAAGT